MIRPGPNALLSTTRRRPGTDDEHVEQSLLFQWADVARGQHPELAALFAVPNFAGRLGTATARHGARLKAEGRRAGVPDVVLPAPRGVWAALYVEMKDADGRVRPAQRDWHVRLAALGNKVEVHRSWESARDGILAYLALPVTPGILVGAQAA